MPFLQLARCGGPAGICLTSWLVWHRANMLVWRAALAAALPGCEPIASCLVWLAFESGFD
jgi:hypothetical protein